MMDTRLYPIEQNLFKSLIQPTIERSYIWKGRPPKISHYQVFCAILYVLRTGIPWRDLPKCFGNWHTIYIRFHRGNEKSLWWRILLQLQQQKKLKMNVVLCDSSSFKFHRHGSGLKKGSNQRVEAYQSGMTTKLHLVLTPNLQIIDGFLTGGNAADTLTADVSGCYVIKRDMTVIGIRKTFYQTITFL